MKFFRNKLAVAIVVLSVAFLILISFSVKNNGVFFMRNGVGVVFNPIQGGIYKLNNGIKQSLSFIFNISDIKEQNKQLTKKNSELENKLVEYNLLKSENSSLRKELNFKKEKMEYNYIGCDIIGRGGSSILDEFTVNRGSNDGIKKGMVAETAEGLVGQVVHVEKNWSIVRSIASENLAVGAEPQLSDTKSQNSDETSDEGIVKGYNQGTNKLLTKLYYLPIESKIKKGDTILTSGIDNSYPRGIRIGSVVTVELDKGKVMKNAVVKPFVDFNKIQEMLIVVPKNQIDVKY
ncbi:rod shape-determining protein MreC [Clostridium tyrobutyricum]|jgi:rod shape-determining protein MreC|uniref:Cell shape-determining protein MreC n=2 Tax=Clostridium tyrobutyricum TaxID=1519 RepID=W6NLY5_CLOTY|nr:rod shape-determining protein MreC [Clostridium tyrobutyricum]AND85709.1 rod shape-determining protein MreC [Clostridium tyrobutyricum]ANP70228.1 rod shape-determining protein MreC [Clostridium tyrobutyricum]MBV4415005.1 rod shape-determining protein MreC [Clostridium tyrobutyricum]MBV4421169.1 rod shape-determining protein MreC [Clostridium tyrobutyricum]MBV4424433.1 rod shape-determining protein MreC [Clostridium tyrobutyricum]